MINAKEKKVAAQLQREEIRLEVFYLRAAAEVGRGERAGQRLGRAEAGKGCSRHREQPVRMASRFSTNIGSGVLRTRRTILG